MERSLIICSIVRDVEKALRRNIPVIQQLCERFSDYHIVVFENDSKDGTKKLLQKWMSSDRNHVHCIMTENLSERVIPKITSKGVNPYYSHKRIDKMAALRNQYMEYIDFHKLTADYLMVVDLDVARLYLDDILSSFAIEEEWDAITAYGYSISPKLRRRFHDCYALWEKGADCTPQTEEQIKNNADRYAKLCKGDKLIPVFSAFGGLAIYKFEAIKNLRYYVEDNNDAHVEVKCEHFSIYKQMIERGYDRIFINPKMTLKYQTLSLNIIYRSLLFRLMR